MASVIVGWIKQKKKTGHLIHPVHCTALRQKGRRWHPLRYIFQNLGWWLGFNCTKVSVSTKKDVIGDLEVPDDVLDLLFFVEINLPSREFVRGFYVSSLQEVFFRRKRQYSWNETDALKLRGNSERNIDGAFFSSFKTTFSECWLTLV